MTTPSFDSTLTTIAARLVYEKLTSKTAIRGAVTALSVTHGQSVSEATVIRLTLRVVQMKNIAKMNRKLPLAAAKRTTPLADALKPPFAK